MLKIVAIWGVNYLSKYIPIFTLFEKFYSYFIPIFVELWKIISSYFIPIQKNLLIIPQYNCHFIAIFFKYTIFCHILAILGG